MTGVQKHGARLFPYFMLLLSTTATILLLFSISLLTDDGVESGKEAPSIRASLLLDEPESEIVSTPENQTEKKPFYTIILSEGELRLCKDGNTDSYTVLEGIDPRTLRDADRLALESGLQLESEEALVSFLEYFSS